MPGSAKLVIGRPEIAVFELGAAQEPGHRYVIEQLLIDADGRAVATNGRILLVGPPRRKEAGPETLVQRETMRRLAAEFKPHVQESRPPHLQGRIEGEVSEAGQWFDLGDQTNLTVPPQPDPGRFPPYQECIPTEKPLVRFCVDARLLARCAKFLETMQPDSEIPAAIEIEVRDLTAPIVMRTVAGRSAPELEGTAVLMPIRDGLEGEPENREEIKRALAKAFPPPAEAEPAKKD